MRNTQLKVEIGERELRFLREAEKVFEGFVVGMEGVGVKVGLGKVNELAGLGNKYMQENAPWEKSRMGNGDSVRTVGLLVAYLRFLLAVLEPFVPGLCGEASKFMKIDQPPRLKNYLGTFDDFCNAFVNTPINNTEFLKPVPLVKECKCL
jgi:methionyl-tRNA synthetase